MTDDLPCWYLKTSHENGESHRIQQDKRKAMEKGVVTEKQRMDFPLCVAMVTAVDGGWLISCTAVQLRGERQRKACWRMESIHFSHNIQECHCGDQLI